MPTITFEDRAAAFIDVLGFKDLVEAATGGDKQLERLQGLVDQLETTIPVLDNAVSKTVPGTLVPIHTSISDCIILSAPLTVSDDKWAHYSGLEIVIMRSIQLTHQFLSSGYLLRGGISVGKLFHNGSNVFGPAYQDAYQIERTTDMPRIELSLAAQSLLKPGTRMHLTYEGKVMVNGLHDFYVPDRATTRIKDVFDEYARIVDKQVGSLAPRARAKWVWFGKYLREEKQHALQWDVK